MESDFNGYGGKNYFTSIEGSGKGSTIKMLLIIILAIILFILLGVFININFIKVGGIDNFTQTKQGDSRKLFKEFDEAQIENYDVSSDPLGLVKTKKENYFDKDHNKHLKDAGMVFDN